MARYSPDYIPSYRLHKASGRGIVTLAGRDHLLPDHGKPESLAEYHRLVADWIAAGRPRCDWPPAPEGHSDGSRFRQSKPETSPEGLTVEELAAAYWLHSKEYYHWTPRNRHRNEASNIRLAIKPVLELYRDTPAAEFGPLKLKAVRDKIVHTGIVRKSVNARVHRIRRMFAWAVENQLLTPSVLHGLQAVAGLKIGRSPAKEGEPVKPVDESFVRSIFPNLSRTVRSMLEVQLLTGARPGEVCRMRSCDIDMSGKVWIYRPSTHKTQHHGKERAIVLGAKAQAIVRQFLTTKPLAYLFSPAEAEIERRALLTQNRKTPVGYGNAIGTNRKKTPLRKPGNHYDTGEYRKAITRACVKTYPIPDHLKRRFSEPLADYRKRLGNKKLDELNLFLKSHRFHPHQIRHTTATKIRKEFGIEAAQVTLGHSNIKTTEIYAEKNLESAIRIAEAIG